jgi:hypothetical protein
VLTNPINSRLVGKQEAMRLLCQGCKHLGIHRQRRLIGKVLFLFALGFPPSQVCQRYIQRAVTQPLHDRGHGQALIRKGICMGFSESVKFRFHHARTLSDGLQLAEEVSLQVP